MINTNFASREDYEEALLGLCRKIKKYVRQKLPQYLTDKKVSLYLKGSACVVSVSVRAFGAVYRMLHCAEFE